MDEYRAPVQQQSWSPYSWNGGTILAIAGEDFSVIASDTRLSEGFQIYTRDSPKSYQLSDGLILGCCGFHGDVLTVTKNIEAQMKLYEHIHHKKMSVRIPFKVASFPGPPRKAREGPGNEATCKGTDSSYPGHVRGEVLSNVLGICGAVAQLLSVMLYHRRFFPFYTYNILAGLDNEGKGCIYSFDPVGSYERESYRAGGSAASMLQPLLDNQIGFKNQSGVEPEPLTVDKAVSLMQDVFSAAAERDIYTGDGLQIHVISASGVDVRVVPLRRD